MNLNLLLESACGAHPDRVAVADDGGSLTYRELEARAGAWAGWMAADLGPGPIVHVGENGSVVVELMFGAARAGRPFAPLNYRLREAELIDLVERLRPAAIVVDERNRAKVAGAGVPLLDTRERPSGTPPDAPFDPSATALLLATSGTTSRPKLAILTHGNLVGYVLDTVEAASAAEDETALVSAPPYHVATAAQVLSNVFRGRRLRFMGSFDAAAWLRVVREERVTHAMVVPTMLGRILDVLDERPELAPRTLRTLSYGGSKAPPGLVERAVRVLGDSVGLVNAFGLTETSSSVCLLGPEDHRLAFASDDPDVRARLESVGRAVPGVEIEIRRADGGVAAPGEVGEVCIRGAHVSPGYVADPSKVDADGWLHTSDTGSLDEAGYLFLGSRADDVIIRGAENIDPAEIERVLAAHPAVRESLVVGVPDPEWGEVVGALVVGAEGVEDAELQEWVRGRLAGFKAPAVIRRVADLPRNDMGKPVRREARAALEAAAC